MNKTGRKLPAALPAQPLNHAMNGGGKRKLPAAAAAV
jgi:hypothetical protein